MIEKNTPTRLRKPQLFRMLGYKPHPGQVAVHRSTASRRVLAAGVRSGKTVCAAMEALAAALEPRERSIGWVVAPTYDLADRVYREIVYVVAKHLKHRIIVLKESEKRLVIRNLGGGLSEIRGKSADNPVSLLGEGLNWVVIDEAARLHPKIWEGHISQRLIDKRGWALLISTPRGKGYLYELWRRGQRGEDPAYASWNFPSRTNPHLDASLIEAERDRLPERVFRQEYEAEFLEGSGAVFRNVRECATGEWQEPIEGKGYWAGLDLAKVEDFTVLTILNVNREVVFVDRFHRLDWNLQVSRIKAAANRYNGAAILVDSTGAGEPVFESLRLADCWVTPYPFTARSKSALIDNLALMLERREIVLPRPEIFPDLVDELEAFQYAVTDQGNVRTSAPPGIHDDTVISLALAAWHLKARPQPAATIIRRRRPAWR